MPRLLRIPDHSGQRDRRGGRTLPAARRRGLRAGGERGGRHQYAVRRRCGGSALHDRLQRSRHQPDAGRLQLPGRRGTALRDCGYHARRARPGQHRARTERLQPDRQGRRPRELPHAGGGAGFGAGNGRPDHPGLRPGRPVSQSGGGAGRRLHRTDDGAGGVRFPRHRSRRRRSGRCAATRRRARIW